MFLPIAAVTRPEIEERVETSSELAPRYHLILLDDNEHTYEYVIELLGRIFGYGKQKSFALARLVDIQGRVIVETADYDRYCQVDDPVPASAVCAMLTA